MGDKKDDAALGAIFGALIGDSIGSYLEFLGK
jgi:ADP-ribosylglycohydrolase